LDFSAASDFANPPTPRPSAHTWLRLPFFASTQTIEFERSFILTVAPSLLTRGLDLNRGAHKETIAIR